VVDELPRAGPARRRSDAGARDEGRARGGRHPIERHVPPDAEERHGGRVLSQAGVWAGVPIGERKPGRAGRRRPGFRHPALHRCGTWRTIGDFSVSDDLLSRITIRPEQMHGRACIRGMRMRVIDVLEMLAGGATPQDILADYPYLEADDISASLAYAVQELRR